DRVTGYTLRASVVRERVKRVYSIGTAAEKVEQQISGAAEIVRAGTLAAAVKHASRAAGPGDVVLLAPACASFDQFQNYEHRGRVFKDLVRQIGTVAKPRGAA